MESFPPRGERLLVRGHVVVEGFQRPGRLFAPAQPFHDRGGRGQRLPAEVKAPFGSYDLEVRERLFARPGAAQPASEVQMKLGLPRVVREFVEHPAEKRDAVRAAGSREALAQQMQRVCREVAARELGRGEPLLRLRPASAPEGVGAETVRGRCAAPARKPGVIGDLVERLLPVPPRFDGGGLPYGCEFRRRGFKSLPRDARLLLGIFGCALPWAGASRLKGGRQQEGEGSGRDPGAPAAKEGGNKQRHMVES